MRKKYTKKAIAVFSVIIVFLNIFSLFGTVFAAEGFEQELINEGFPYAYRVYLTALHKKYPEWVFKALVTNLDFNVAVEGERKNHGSNFTNKTGIDKRPGYTLSGSEYRDNCDICTTENAYIIKENPSWYSMSAASLAYYMNPLNFLDEKYIFMFEYLGYDETNHNIEGVKKILAGTFMEGDKITYLDSSGQTETINKSYAQVIMEAARQSGASPYYLAARIRQESGVNGSDSVSGNYYSEKNAKAYKGLYNFYNIGAYSSAPDPVAAGLEYAGETGSYLRPWSNPEIAIKGGADWIASKYIAVGQSTNYLQKFNVTPHNTTYPLYTHQYMTNAHAPSSEAYSTYLGYYKQGQMSDMKIFFIPIYKNLYSSYDDANIKKYYNISFSSVSQPTGTVINPDSSDNIRLRTGPGTTYNQFVYNPSNPSSVASGDYVRVSLGTAVTVKEQIYTGNTQYPLWYHISYTANSVSLDGWIPSKYVRLNPSVNMYVGNSETFTATPGDTNDTDLKSVVYSSSDSAVALIEPQTGKVIAKKVGSTVITATASTGQTDSFLLKITERISVVSPPSHFYYVKGEKIGSPGGTLRVEYSENNYTDIPITADMISGFDSQTPGEKRLTLNYGGLSDFSYNITVFDAVKGNIDGDKDNSVNLVDCLKLLIDLKYNSHLSYSPEETAVADLSGDGSVGMLDALMLFRKAANIEI